jgi:hypothetical protein
LKFNGLKLGLKWLSLVWMYGEMLLREELRREKADSNQGARKVL